MKKRKKEKGKNQDNENKCENTKKNEKNDKYGKYGKNMKTFWRSFCIVFNFFSEWEKSWSNGQCNWSTGPLVSKWSLYGQSGDNFRQ